MEPILTSSTPPAGGFPSAVRTGLRLAVFRKVTRSEVVSSPGLLVALVALLTGLDIFGELAITGWHSTFSPYGGYYSAAALVMFLLAVALVNVATRGRVGATALAVLVLSATLLPSLVLTAVTIAWWQHDTAAVAWGHQYPPEWAAFALILLWTIILVWRAIGTLQPGRHSQRIALTVGFVAIVTAGDAMTAGGSYWYQPVDDTAYAPPHEEINVQDVFYAQGPLMERATANLERGVPGKTELFLLGYAGDGNQDAFMNEVNYLGELFAERFDAGRRTIKLVNNAATVDALPLANAPNLARSVNALAGRMDRDEDVLMVFLTSHGSRDATLSNSFWPLDLNELDAATLGRTLDESGAKWRIVVVSACFSGSFIDALSGPDTLVITAAAADRSSFGCDEDSEYTYFGRHFLTEALAHNASFRAAFELARERITAQELAEGRTPSQPQIVVGDAIGEKLAELEATARLTVSARSGAPVEMAPMPR